MNEKLNAAMTAYAASPTEANRAAIVEAVAPELSSEIRDLKACIAKQQESLVAAKRRELDQSAPIQSAEVAELRKLAEAATPGPWRVEDHDCSNDSNPSLHVGQVDEYAMRLTVQSFSVFPERKARIGGKAWKVLESRAIANADYIAAANPAAILRLLDALSATPAQPIADVSAPTDEAILQIAADTGLKIRTGQGAIKFARALLARVAAPSVSAPTDEPFWWLEAEESARGCDPRDVFGKDSMLYSTRTSLTKPTGNNPCWPLYLHAARAAAPVSGQGASAWEWAPDLKLADDEVIHYSQIYQTAEGLPVMTDSSQHSTWNVASVFKRAADGVDSRNPVRILTVEPSAYIDSRPRSEDSCAKVESIADNHDAMIILTQGYERDAVIRVVDAHAKRQVGDAIRALASSAPESSGEVAADVAFTMAVPSKRQVRDRLQERCYHDYKHSASFGGDICAKCGMHKPAPVAQGEALTDAMRLDLVYQLGMVEPFIAPIATKEKWIESIDAILAKRSGSAGA